ncbi:MAG: ABC transporter permease [Actinobacteria bacterium]|nr:ABC transporter permease [Actinomycetota bacterium]
MNNSILVVILASAVFYGTPLFFAALGGVFAERSGVLNLGTEGMMLLGAVAGAATAAHVDGPKAWVLFVSLLAAMLAGGLGALLHAFAVVTLRVNQTVSGLALTILAGGAGLSSYLAKIWTVDRTPVSFNRLDLFGLGDMAVLGPIVFDQNLLTYLSWLVCGVASWYLFRTRPGLHLRAVGESPQTADAAGISVVKYRYVHTVLGGMLAGVGGAYVSLAMNSTWSDGITGGIGWIAIALVIFGFWRPDLTLVGSYLFGAFTSLNFVLQTRGVKIAPQILSSLPYVMTIVVLVAVSAGWSRKRVGAPAALGVPYEREER